MITFLFLLFLNFVQIAQAAEQPIYIEVILDASGSMTAMFKGTLKITEAKRLMKSFLVSNNGQANMHLALRVYGSQKTQDCKDSKLYFDFTEHKIDDIVTTIERLKPQPLAKTPLAKSLEQAADDMKDKKGRKFIFLVTDGEETCGGDPCKIAQEIKKKYDIKIQVIGYGVENTDAIKQLGCISEDGVKLANDSQELSQALSSLNDEVLVKNIQINSPDPHAMVRVYDANRKGKKIALVKSFAASMGTILPPTKDDRTYVVDVLLDPTYSFPPFTLNEKEKKVLTVKGDGNFRLRFLDGALNFGLVDKAGKKISNLKSDQLYSVECGNYNAEFFFPPYVNMEKKDNIIIVPKGKRTYSIENFGGLYVSVENKPFLGYYLFDKAKDKDIGSFVSDQLLVLPVGSYKIKINDTKLIEEIIVLPNKIQKVSIKP